MGLPRPAIRALAAAQKKYDQAKRAHWKRWDFLLRLWALFMPTAVDDFKTRRENAHQRILNSAWTDTAKRLRAIKDANRAK